MIVYAIGDRVTYVGHNHACLPSCNIRSTVRELFGKNGTVTGTDDGFVEVSWDNGNYGSGGWRSSHLVPEGTLA